MADILDGKAIAGELRERIAASAARLRNGGRPPGLATVIVGEHPASLSYIRGKKKACEECGIVAHDIRLPESASQGDLIDELKRLNAAEDVHGVLVQQPLPDHINVEDAVAIIDPKKDVDGFHPVSLGRLLRGLPVLAPCTPYGIIKMLEHADVETAGARVTIVGRSLLVGKPLAALLLRKGPGGNATVTVCHSGTSDLAAATRDADILVAAIGRPEFIGEEMVREGSVVIDVGINRVDDSTKKRGYRLVGDVNYASVSKKARLITPVPGGVGPLTVAMLLYNTIQAASGRSSFEELP